MKKPEKLEPVVTHLEDLNADVDINTAIKKPLFFMPINGDMNILNGTIEPYTNSVALAMGNRSTYNSNDRSYIWEYQSYISNMFIDILNTNINIIIDNGIINELAPFFTVPRGEVFTLFMSTGKYSLNMVRSCISSYNYALGAQRSVAGDHEVFSKLSQLRMDLSTEYAKIFYQFINTIMLNGMVDIRAFGDYIKNECGIEGNVEQSYTSLCIQSALQLADADILKITEYGELLLVNVLRKLSLFYTENKELVDKVDAERSLSRNKDIEYGEF